MPKHTPKRRKEQDESKEIGERSKRPRTEASEPAPDSGTKRARAASNSSFPATAKPASAGGSVDDGGNGADTPKFIPRKKRGRGYTVSIALPGSIVDNAQSPELQAYLTSQIARAAAIFCVDEIVVFDESSKKAGAGTAASAKAAARGWDANHFLARLLQYQETPQYLRRALIPRHKDLRNAGLLNPLDSPHHMRADDPCRYREGVVVKRPCPKGSFVNVGIYKDVRIDQKVPAGVRVTVKMPKKRSLTEDGKLKRDGKKVRATAVAPSEPRETAGLYWGYQVRLANSISEGGYDLTVGTSERGNVSVDDVSFSLPAFRHILIVFGGVAGLEASVDADEQLNLRGEDTSALFDMWVNTCPVQGSRTIRTEEAILISMAGLRRHITSNTVPTS